MKVPLPGDIIEYANEKYVVPDRCLRLHTKDEVQAVAALIAQKASTSVVTAKVPDEIGEPRLFIVDGALGLCLAKAVENVAPHRVKAHFEPDTTVASLDDVVKLGMQMNTARRQTTSVDQSTMIEALADRFPEMSQSEIATRVGCSQSKVSRVLTKKRNEQAPNADKLAQLRKTSKFVKRSWSEAEAVAKLLFLVNPDLVGEHPEAVEKARHSLSETYGESVGKEIVGLSNALGDAPEYPISGDDLRTAYQVMVASLRHLRDRSNEVDRLKDAAAANRDAFLLMEEVRDLLVAKNPSAFEKISVEVSSAQRRQLVISGKQSQLGEFEVKIGFGRAGQKMTSQKTFELAVGGEEYRTYDWLAQSDEIVSSVAAFVNEKTQEHLQKLREKPAEDDSVEGTGPEVSETPQDASVDDSQTDTHVGSLDATEEPEDAPETGLVGDEAPNHEDSEEVPDAEESIEQVLNDEPESEEAAAAAE